MESVAGLSIGDYLIEKLRLHGVSHVFGVPGDYVLGFFGQLDRSSLQIVNTCDEQAAGFAADAYARLRGLGAVAVTYCVGGLKLANSTAQAFAEKSPVIVISGAPGTNERKHEALLHHKVRGFDTQLRVFEQLTVASCVLDDPETAFREIDRVFAAALRYRRPVYIELPRDMAGVEGVFHAPLPAVKEASDPDGLREILGEAVERINGARQPAILAGEELHRFGLQEHLARLVEKTHIPVASTILGKSVFDEDDPHYLGVYEGAMSREQTRAYIEASDCLILLGALMTDVNLGIYTAHLDQKHSIYATNEKLSIGYHVFEQVRLEDFIAGLIEAEIVPRDSASLPGPEPVDAVEIVSGKPVSVLGLFKQINEFIDEQTVVIAEPGDALFGSLDLHIRGCNRFLSPAYYTSLGFGVPAALGAQLAVPGLRPLVLVGDGAFQMTGMELSTIVRFGLNPIVVVLNNRGYATERPLEDGTFNDILLWRYCRLPDVLGAGQGFNIQTEGQLAVALQFARQHTGSFCLLDVHLDPRDSSPGLQRFTQSLSERMHSAAC